MTGIKSASATAQLSAGRNGGKLPGVEGQTCNNWTFDHTTAIIKSHEVSRCQEKGEKIKAWNVVTLYACNT